VFYGSVVSCHHKYITFSSVNKLVDREIINFLNHYRVNSKPVMSQKDKEKKQKEAWLKNFGKHLKYVRTQRGMTGVELAHRLRLDKQSISRIETGNVNPSIYLIQQICDVLDCELKDFFEEFQSK
jgi:putative transcriptional regulator